MLRHPILKIQAISPERYEVSGVDLAQFSKRRFWVFDLEATGLDTNRERITQVAGARVERGQIIEESAFSQLVYPGDDIEIPQEVQELTGITPERVRGAPPFPEVWCRCLEAAKGCDFWIGQSVFEFDVPLLYAELARHGLESRLPPMLDTVVVATALLGEPAGRWSTSALIQRFEVNTDGLRRHDALDDVKIAGRILLPMLELIRNDHGDRLRIPTSRPLSVKRHAPIGESAPEG
jgi:DNA polymerase III epsilon subunit-like protein